VLWYQGAATVGTVAAAAALVLRLNNMTYWIMWATTSLVQALGVVAEGMETIAQPIALVDAPGAAAAPDRRADRVAGCQPPLRARVGRACDGVSLTIAPGEKIGWWAGRARASRRWSS
jgi:ATP-binding cassette, subfamily B, multidrug efflux pump